METYELERMGVRELRKVCKENGNKNYAWLKKVELIFLIQGFDTDCGNCDRKLRAEEMAHYLEDMTENGGLNWSDEYVACCAECLEWQRDMCFRCGEFYIHAGLEEAETPDTGETLYICRHCSKCSRECQEHVDNIQEENWVDDSLYCDDCLPKTCYFCEKNYRNADTDTKILSNGKEVIICDECDE